MNIIEMEDMVKGLPDQVLFQEAQTPSGRIPQFLALSEVQRRQDMRQRFSARQEQQGTVKDQILQGIGGISPPPMGPEMAPPMAPQMGPQMAPPMQPPVQGMAEGGVVKMQRGGISPFLPPASPPPYSPFMPEYMVNAPIVELGPTTVPPPPPEEPVDPTLGLARDIVGRGLIGGGIGYDPEAILKPMRDLYASEEFKQAYAPVDLSEERAAIEKMARDYQTEADQSIQAMREQAKKDAFAYALMQMGAGLAGGDMARGLERGAEAAFGVLDKSKQLESEERRIARAEARALQAQSMNLGIESKKLGKESQRELLGAQSNLLSKTADVLVRAGSDSVSARNQSAQIAAQILQSSQANIRSLKEQDALNSRNALNAIIDTVKEAGDSMPQTAKLDPVQAKEWIDQSVMSTIRIIGITNPSIKTDELIRAYRGISGQSGASQRIDPLGLR